MIRAKVEWITLPSWFCLLLKFGAKLNCNLHSNNNMNQRQLTINYQGYCCLHQSNPIHIGTACKHFSQLCSIIKDLNDTALLYIISMINRSAFLHLSFEPYCVQSQPWKWIMHYVNQVLLAIIALLITARHGHTLDSSVRLSLLLVADD